MSNNPAKTKVNSSKLRKSKLKAKAKKIHYKDLDKSIVVMTDGRNGSRFMLVPPKKSYRPNPAKLVYADTTKIPFGWEFARKKD